MFLEIKGIKKHYGEGESRVEVLNGIDIEVNKGEIVVLLGPSGSGKSTLLNIIGGIDDADEGYISIDGEKTADMNEKRLTQYRRKHLGYVFQMYNLIPNLTATSLNVITLSAIFLIASLCVTIIIVLPYFLLTSSISFNISLDVL